MLGGSGTRSRDSALSPVADGGVEPARALPGAGVIPEKEYFEPDVFSGSSSVTRLRGVCWGGNNSVPGRVT
jgi:hypothetical protein